MTLHSQIKEQIKEAMKARDEVGLTTLRGLLAGFTNELVAMRKPPQGELSDEEALNVVKRSVKQHKDSIEQFSKGSREDLVSSEKAELAILEKYLPEQMPEEKIREIAKIKIEELKITDKSKIGVLVGAIMKETKGEADGGIVKKIAEEMLNF